MMGRAPNTIDAYARGLQEFLQFCAGVGVDAVAADRACVARYVAQLLGKASPHGAKVLAIDSGAGLSNATIQQRLTVLRTFFDFLVEEGLRKANPVGRGAYSTGRFRRRAARGMVPRFRRLPWIPSEADWRSFLRVARAEPIRNRFMLGLAYDCGLRREELCSLLSSDLDPAHRLVRIRAETTKGRADRVVVYSAATGILLRQYLRHRSTLYRGTGPLFVSESRRNRAQPITLWTWSKVVRQLATRAELPRFSTHTLRHLCLTDLARAGWELHEIASFAGHKNPATTQLYIHLSGRDLAERMARTCADLRRERVDALPKSARAPS